MLEILAIIMQASLSITVTISQFASYIKYKMVPPFWDGIIHMYPQRFNDRLRWSKVIILTMISISLCTLAAAVGIGLNSIIKPEPEAADIQPVKTWAKNNTEARVAWVRSLICFLPTYLTWIGARIQFMVAAYNLRWGFRNLHSLMFYDTPLVNQLTLHKNIHLRLSQLTGDLGNILWGYTRASMAMCIFDMCFVIFALHESHESSEIMGFVSLLILVYCIIGIIVMFIISANTWVSWWFYTSWSEVHRNEEIGTAMTQKWLC